MVSVACPLRELRRSSGCRIARSSEERRGVWLLRAGHVARVAPKANGPTCSVVGPGSVLGLEVLLDCEPAFDLIALTDCVLCFTSRSTLLDWLGGEGSPARAVLRLSIANGIHRDEERVNLIGTARQRVARYLLWSRRSRARAMLPHKTLASVLGMRAETLSRALRDLRTVGVLEPAGPLAVIDWGRLEQIADGASWQACGAAHDDDTASHTAKK